MDASQLSVSALIVMTVVGAVKDQWPTITGNQTRLLAIGVGGLLGYLAQAGYVPLPGVDLVEGIISGAAAVGVHTAARAIGKGS